MEITDELLTKYNIQTKERRPVAFLYAGQNIDVVIDKLKSISHNLLDARVDIYYEDGEIMVTALVDKPIKLIQDELAAHIRLDELKQNGIQQRVIDAKKFLEQEGFQVTKNANNTNEN